MFTTPILWLGQPFQEAAESQAKAILESSASHAKLWQEDFVKHFPYSTLSQAAEALEKHSSNATETAASAAVAATSALSSALGATVSLMDKVSTDLTVVEQYITLTIPQMEDGNNFGVSIQLQAIKQITDARESMDKALEELIKYSSARAEALEKCKLVPATTSITETSTESKSSSQENADPAKTTAASSTETKSVTTKTEPNPTPEQVWRRQALVAVDLLYYSKAKNAYSRTLMAYLSALDFYFKNETKITQPKGSRDGSSTGYQSMY